MTTTTPQAHGDTHHGDYVKIWGILVALLVVSVVGPMFGIRALTLVTAFGIAFVKAYLVAKNFMHVTAQPRFVGAMLLTALALMLLMFAGVAPDVLNHKGTNWVNKAANDAVERGLAAAAAHADGHETHEVHH